jgi:hypothetical protein
VRSKTPGGQRASERRAIYPGLGRIHKEATSIGDAFVTPDAYRSWIERFPSRGPAGPGEYRCARRVTPLKARSLRRHKTELEDQIVTGDGTGENFTGLMNVSGSQTLSAPVAPASNLPGDNAGARQRALRAERHRAQPHRCAEHRPLEGQR